MRVATASDIEPIVSTLTTAFFDDPLWGPAFPDERRRSEQAAALWRLCASSALRYPWTLITERAEAVALWIPPGGTELTEQEEGGLGELLTTAAGADIAHRTRGHHDVAAGPLISQSLAATAVR